MCLPRLLPTLALFVFGLFASPVAAVPRTYALDAGNSTVGFTWFFGADAVTGQMPVATAGLTIDFAAVGQSTVSVAVDVTGAEAGFPFASQAMKGPKVLDAANYPQITFVSRSVTSTGPNKATIDGDITVRGVTKPAQFAAEIYRQTGTTAGDLDHLVILLTGALDRRDFGADGWPDMVGPQVQLRILASISAAP